MSKLEVFKISEDVVGIDLDSNKIRNIDLLFSKLIGKDSNLNHLKILCELEVVNQIQGSILYDFKTSGIDFDFKKFGTKLLEAEKTKKGVRSKSISEGYLFTRYYEKKLVLLKLEGTEVIDGETFEEKIQLGTDAEYYKICIFELDYDNIIVIDKNSRATQYWVEKFLSLTIKRDSRINTKDVIKLIKNDTIFTEAIKSLDNFDEIKVTTENYLFENKIFNKTVLLSQLNRLGLIDVSEESDLFSENSSALDSEFIIDEKEVNKEYKKTLEISENTKIYTKNFSKLKREGQINLEDGWLSIKVNDAFLEKIKAELS